MENQLSISKDLYMEERRQGILALLDKLGRVSVSDLSDRFSVSEVTIRADLQALADGGMLMRTHHRIGPFWGNKTRRPTKLRIHT